MKILLNQNPPLPHCKTTSEGDLFDSVSSRVSCLASCVIILGLVSYFNNNSLSSKAVEVIFKDNIALEKLASSYLSATSAILTGLLFTTFILSSGRSPVKSLQNIDSLEQPYNPSTPEKTNGKNMNLDNIEPAEKLPEEISFQTLNEATEKLKGINSEIEIAAQSNLYKLKTSDKFVIRFKDIIKEYEEESADKQLDLIVEKVNSVMKPYGFEHFSDWKTFINFEKWLQDPEKIIDLYELIITELPPWGSLTKNDFSYFEQLFNDILKEITQDETFSLNDKVKYLDEGYKLCLQEVEPSNSQLNIIISYIKRKYYNIQRKKFLAEQQLKSSHEAHHVT